MKRAGPGGGVRVCMGAPIQRLRPAAFVVGGKVQVIVFNVGVDVASTNIAGPPQSIIPPVRCVSRLESEFIVPHFHILVQQGATALPQSHFEIAGVPVCRSQLRSC